MTEEEYLQSRLTDQISWYSKKSTTNKKWFRSLSVVSIILSASIPFLACSFDSFIFKCSIGIIGVLVTIITSILSLFKFHEHWIEYRTTSETLKHEKYMFLTKHAPYDDSEAFLTLVNRVESLISVENSKWNSQVSLNKNCK